MEYTFTEPSIAPTGAWSLPDGSDAGRAARGDAPRCATRDGLAPSITCVLPCRNEGANLDLLVPRLQRVLEDVATRSEIVLVDDGSDEESARVMVWWSLVPGVRLLQLSRNFGKEAALTAGLEAARGDLVVLMDADLQHEPELIPALLEKWRGGADMVYAARRSRCGESAVKRAGARLFYSLINSADRFDVPADGGDFRLLDRKVVDALLALPERNRFMKGLYAWVGFKAAAVPYMPAQRSVGHSHFNMARLIRLSIDGLTAFTTWPLRAVSLAGLVFAALAFAYGAYLSLVYVAYGHVVSGWTTIVVGLMLFSGIQLISLGVVGEYVARVFEEAKGRPLYILERELGHGLAARPA